MKNISFIILTAFIYFIDEKNFPCQVSQFRLQVQTHVKLYQTHKQNYLCYFVGIFIFMIQGKFRNQLNETG